MRKSAYLIGPFIGELLWEFYRFAPYVIYLKKKNPKAEFVIFTREERFDLYGRYGSVLVPLRIQNDHDLKNAELFAQNVLKNS